MGSFDCVAARFTNGNFAQDDRRVELSRDVFGDPCAANSRIIDMRSGIDWQVHGRVNTIS